MNWFVELPGDTQLAVLGLVAVVVSLAIELAIVYFPWLSFLRNYAQEWGMLLGVVVLEALQNWLPSEYPEASILAVQLVLAIIAIIMGVRKFLINRGVSKLASD